MKFEKMLEAKELRKQGMPVGQIAKKIGCAKSSVSVWVRDIILSPEQIKKIMDDKHSSPGQLAGSNKNKEIFLKKRTEYQQEGRDKAKEKDPLHMAGCMLYWAEGTKNRNSCQFCNSDKNMLILFKRFLLESLNVNKEDITIYIHCYDDVKSQSEIEEYWLRELDLSKSCLRKTQVNNIPSSRRVKGNRKKLPYGTLHMVVNSCQIVQHIFGAIQEYGNFENLEWVK
jgi:predicted transcriptional regulator